MPPSLAAIAGSDWFPPSGINLFLHGGHGRCSASTCVLFFRRDAMAQCGRGVFRAVRIFAREAGASGVCMNERGTLTRCANNPRKWGVQRTSQNWLKQLVLLSLLTSESDDNN